MMPKIASYVSKLPILMILKKAIKKTIKLKNIEFENYDKNIE